MFYAEKPIKELSLLTNNSLVSVDMKNKSITINGDLSIHITGNLKISSDEEIFINSGRTLIPNTDHVRAIHLNSDLDKNGKLIRE